jgi:hypothetical protein
MDKHQLQAALPHFTGSENFYRHPLSGLIYTDGIQYLAENAGNGAYWLIDAIGSYQRDQKVRGNPRLMEFQLWELKLNGKGGAVLTCREDSGKGNPPKITQEIEYTDFPLDEIKLYVENNTLCLPSER